ncbi:MAG: hybrid sensor histidine kinase/response regulator [Anaerolineales bacterium]|nr:hybrid sensor histidine kinase/response regulator [Anaerolineales bacterium]
MHEPRSKPRILAVDDKLQNLYALEKLLTQLDVEIIQATSGFEALSLTLEHDFCLAIVDVQMPEMDGYELVELLRGNPSTANLPVIFVSAIFSDEYHHCKGYDAGAVDFLSKPFIPEILLSKTRIFLDLYHQRSKLEKLVNQLNAKNEILENEIKQRQEAETALQSANRDKDRLFSIISHDLRNPFQVLLGNAELMLEGLEHLSNADIAAMTQSVYRSARTAFNLLENLLTWSRLQQERIEYDPGPVDLHELAENTVALLQETAISKRIRLNHTIEEELFAYADSYMIDTIIRNLTSNALKFTPAEGQVTLSAHRNGVSPDQPDAKWVEVKVCDTGLGISPENIAKLFKLDVHHTTPGTAQEAGTGLGLILCQEMVKKNGGQIWIESEEKKGTTVIFTVPATDSPSPEKG